MNYRVQYVVSTAPGQWVRRFSRGRAAVPSQYTATAYTADKDDACRLSLNIAQAVARKNRGQVETI